MKACNNLNHIRIPLVLKILEQGPMTTRSIVDQMGVSIEAGRVYVTRAKQQNLIHIVDYDIKAPIYAAGPGVDAPMPTDDQLRMRQRMRDRKRVSYLAEDFQLFQEAARMRQGSKASPWDALNSTLFRVAA